MISDDRPRGGDKIVTAALAFGMFIFAQVFNPLNCRKLSNELEFLAGITKKSTTMIEVIGTVTPHFHIRECFDT